MCLSIAKIEKFFGIAKIRKKSAEEDIDRCTYKITKMRSREQLLPLLQGLSVCHSRVAKLQ